MHCLATKREKYPINLLDPSPRRAGNFFFWKHDPWKYSFSGMSVNPGNFRNFLSLEVITIEVTSPCTTLRYIFSQFLNYYFFFTDKFPGATPDFLLLMEELCKSFLARDPSTSSFQFLRTLEVTVHKYKDDLDAFLVYFAAAPGGEDAVPLELEFEVRHVDPADLGKGPFLHLMY